MGLVSLLSATLVLLSIDGLKPDYVFDAATHGVAVPNLRRMVEEGAYATAVTGVYPTVTYPSHTTLLTGVSPARHGVFSNRPFDPFEKNLDGWYWYAEDLTAETLWERVENAGSATASVDWPVSVGARISNDIVQYWRAGNAEDRKVIRALSTPGLLREAEAALGPYPEGYDYGLEADRKRIAFVEYVLKEKNPRFLTAYLAGLDTEEHESGPESAGTFEVLEALDRLVGRIRERCDVLAVVSDHGFAATDKEVHLNAALRRAGLIDVDGSGAVTDYRAFAWNQGGSAMVLLRTPGDERSRAVVFDVLRDLASKPENGISRVLSGEEARALGGFPGAAFVIGLATGYRTGSSLEGPVVRTGAHEGTHGYLPERHEMDSAFFLVGDGIPRGVDLGRIDMRDIAPTLAGLLDVTLPAAEGRDLLKAHAKNDSQIHRR